MIKASAIFLQAASVLIGCAVLGVMLLVPPHEGRNANATLFAVYFKDPFLAYVYLGSIPFFTALWRLFGIFGDLGRGEVFLPRTVKALRTVRYCALATAGVAAGAAAFIRLTAPAGEDTAGFVIPGLLAILFSAGTAAGAVLCENIVRGVLEQKNKNG